MMSWKRPSGYLRLFPNLQQRVSWQKQEKEMKESALSEFKDELSKCLRLAEREQVVITRIGLPGVNIQSLKLADERGR